MAGLFLQTCGYASACDDINVFTFLRSTLDIPDDTIGLCKQGVILATTNVRAGMKMRSTLPDQDVTCQHSLAAIALHAKAFGF